MRNAEGYRECQVLCPVCATPAMPHGTAGRALPAFSYAMTYSLTASPAVVVRAGMSAEGLPISVQIVAQQWREDLALSAAQAIETALGGWKPPLIFRIIGKPVEEAAQTAIDLASAPPYEGVSGHVFSNRNEVHTSRQAQDAILQRRLWQVREAFTALSDRAHTHGAPEHQERMVV